MQKIPSFLLAIILSSIIFIGCAGAIAGEPDASHPDSKISACTLDSCADGEVCHDGIGCAPRCNSDKDCKASNRVCQSTSGRCVECQKNSDCKTGSHCKKNICVAVTPCKTSKSCPDGLICNQIEGICVQCMSDSDCDGDRICSDSVCTPKPVKCLSDKHCAPYGQVCLQKSVRCVDCISDSDCASWQHCKSNACVEDVCQAGSKSCRGNAVISCDSRGAAMSQESCKDGETCSSGVCTGSAITPDDNTKKDTENADTEDMCVTGSTMCDRDKIKTCVDGRWQESKDCQQGKSCIDGVCASIKICTPDERKCIGNTIMICNHDGTIQKEIKCANTLICQEGACIPPPKPQCDPGSFKCIGRDRYICHRGTSWDMYPCDKGMSCKDGVCVK